MTGPAQVGRAWWTEALRVEIERVRVGIHQQERTRQFVVEIAIVFATPQRLRCRSNAKPRWTEPSGRHSRLLVSSPRARRQRLTKKLTVISVKPQPKGSVPIDDEIVGLLSLSLSMRRARG